MPEVAAVMTEDSVARSGSSHDSDDDPQPEEQAGRDVNESSDRADFSVALSEHWLAS